MLSRGSGDLSFAQIIRRLSKRLSLAVRVLQRRDRSDQGDKGRQNQHCAIILHKLEEPNLE